MDKLLFCPRGVDSFAFFEKDGLFDLSTPGGQLSTGGVRHHSFVLFKELADDVQVVLHEVEGDVWCYSK